MAITVACQKMTYSEDTIIYACQSKIWFGWVHHFVVCYGGKQFSFNKNTPELTGGLGKWWGLNEDGLDHVCVLR